jgi:hypothetical protein
MNPKMKLRALTASAALVSGIALLGTSGAAFVFGWVLWAGGLVVLLTALPPAGDDDRRPAAVGSLR